MLFGGIHHFRSVKIHAFFFCPFFFFAANENPKTDVNDFEMRSQQVEPPSELDLLKASLKGPEHIHLTKSKLPKKGSLIARVYNNETSDVRVIMAPLNHSLKASSPATEINNAPSINSPIADKTKSLSKSTSMLNKMNNDNANVPTNTENAVDNLTLDMSPTGTMV